MPARRRQRVEDVSAHIEHAALEDREKPDRPGADDRDVAAFGIVAHVASLRRLDAGVHLARKQILRSLASGIYNARAMIVTELPDEAATAALAARIAALARPGDVIALKGELGTGKTSFARAFIRARGGGEAVPSPTFTLVQIYEIGERPDLAFRCVPAARPRRGLGTRHRGRVSRRHLADRMAGAAWAAAAGPAAARSRCPTPAPPNARRAALDPGGGWADRLAGLAAER